MKKKIVFLGYGGGHITILDKVAETFVDDNDVELIFIPLNGAIPFVKSRYDETSIFQLSKFSDVFDENLDEIFSYGIKLLEENYNPNIGLSKLESIYYLGLSYYNLVLQTNAIEAKKIYKERKRQAFKPVEVMAKIFDKIKPDIVITTNSPRFEVAALIAAKKLNILSMQILDLFGDDYPVPSADHIVVLNKKVADKLVERGNNSSIFHPLGQPIFDETVRIINGLDINKIKQISGLPNKRILLFGPTRNYVYNDDLSIKEELDCSAINDAVFEILDEIAILLNIHIILRPHPSDHISNYKAYIEGKSHYSYLPQLSIYEAIGVSSFVLSYSSTIVVQAVVSKRKAFTFNQTPNRKYNWPEFCEKPFIYASDFIQLKRNLFEYINDNETLEIGSFFEDGSVQKINSLIKNLLN